MSIQQSRALTTPLKNRWLFVAACTWLVLAAASLVQPAVAQDLEAMVSEDGERPDAPSEQAISLESNSRTDEDIRQRLAGIYGELEALTEVRASVTNGIVTIEGTVPSSQASVRAVQMARQLEGVVDVVDELTIDTDVARRVDTTLGKMQDFARSLIASLPVFLLALTVVIAFWFLGRWVARRRGLYARMAPNTFIADLLSLLTRILIVLLGVVLALTLLDATSILGSVLGAAGIVGLALGFAVRDTVENFIASILLSLRTPFIARDYVRIGEHEGTVARLTSRATILVSIDGNHLRIPNALVYKAVVVNFTRQPERRFSFDLGVDTELDLNHAQQTALDTLYGVPGVLETPAASVLVSKLGDSNVSLTLSAWVDQRTNDLLKVRSEAIRQVKQAFDDEGIAMPEPIYRVRWQGGALDLSALQPFEGQSDKPESTSKDSGHQGDRTRRRSMPSRRPDNEAGDTSIDPSAAQGVERELSESGSENLLHEGSRTE